MLPHFAVGLIAVGSIVVAGALIAVVVSEFHEAWEETRRSEESRARSSAVMVPMSQAGMRRRRGGRDDDDGDSGEKVRPRHGAGGGLRGAELMPGTLQLEKRGSLADEDPFRIESSSDGERVLRPSTPPPFPDAPPRSVRSASITPTLTPQRPLSRSSSYGSIGSSVPPLFSPLSSPAPRYEQPGSPDWDLIRSTYPRDADEGSHIGSGWSAVGSETEDWDRLDAGSDSGSEGARVGASRRRGTAGSLGLVGAGSLREY